MTREHHAIHCSVEQCELENDNGHMVASIEATCPKCGHITQSFGTGERSVKRCLVLMREECPLGEQNYYVADENDSFEARDPNPAVNPEHEPEPDATVYDQDDIPF